jgi:hypothetical protein
VTVDYEDGSASEGVPAEVVPGPTAATTAPSAPAPAAAAPPGRRRQRLGAPIAHLISAIRSSDDAAIEAAVLQVSRKRRWLAPLALAVSAIVMMFQGVKLLVTNWRLTLVQVIPAMWIWVAMLDIKIHVLHGRQFHVLHGAVLIPAVLVVTALTAASFYLNAVFAFAISEPGRPEIRPAFGRARRHLPVILAWGCAVGLALSFSTLIVTRWGTRPFALSQSIVVGVMMFFYLAVPARLVGIEKVARSRKDKLAAAAVGGGVGAVVESPPYLLGRLGILMLGWHYVFWLGVILIVIGAALQTGATSAVKAVKFSASLVGNPSGLSGDTDTEPAVRSVP